MRRILKFFLKIYQVLSPAFHYLSYTFGYPGSCRFPESCSSYAQRQINDNSSIISAIYMIIRRLISCSPWGSFQHNFLKAKRKDIS